MLLVQLREVRLAGCGVVIVVVVTRVVFLLLRLNILF